MHALRRNSFNMTSPSQKRKRETKFVCGISIVKFFSYTNSLSHATCLVSVMWFPFSDALIFSPPPTNDIYKCWKFTAFFNSLNVARNLQWSHLLVALFFFTSLTACECNIHSLWSVWRLHLFSSLFLLHSCFFLNSQLVTERDSESIIASLRKSSCCNG